MEHYYDYDNSASNWCSEEEEDNDEVLSDEEEKEEHKYKGSAA